MARYQEERPVTYNSKSSKTTPIFLNC